VNYQVRHWFDRSDIDSIFCEKNKELRLREETPRPCLALTRLVMATPYLEFIYKINQVLKHLTHRFNMESHLQSIFRLQCTAVLIGWEAGRSKNIRIQIRNTAQLNTCMCPLASAVQHRPCIQPGKCLKNRIVFFFAADIQEKLKNIQYDRPDL